VTIQAVEEGNLGNVAGALTICGVVAGSRNWDGALDIRLDVRRHLRRGARRRDSGRAEGLPAGSTFTPPTSARPSTPCFSPTPQGFQRLGQFLAVTKIRSNFIGPTWVRHVAMSNLVHDPHKLAGKVGTGNEGVDYGDPSIDAAIAE